MAMLTGNEIVEGVKTINKFYEAAVGTANTITLPQIPTSMTSVYLLDSDGITNKTLLSAATVPETPTADEYSVDLSTGVLTFHDDNIGARVRVYYKAETGADAKTVKVTSDKFGGTYKMVADVLIRDESTSQDFFGQFIVPRAKIEDDFSFNFSPEGDPSVLDIPIEILKDPQSTDMWELVIYG